MFLEMIGGRRSERPHVIDTNSWVECARLAIANREPVSLEQPFELVVV